MVSDLHNHSTFSDGINTCEEIIQQAIFLGLERVGLVEHVWRKSEWVSTFIDTTNRLKEKYKDVIQIVTGLEAKALSCSGEVDLNDQWRNQVDFILGAIHRIPSRVNQFHNPTDLFLDKNKVYEDWYLTVQGMLKNEIVDIVAHPAAELNYYQIPLNNQEMKILSDLGRRFKKVFEVNIKHQVPVAKFLTHLIDEDIPLSIGSDSHSIREQQVYIKDLIAAHKMLAFHNLI